jgi:hypothetical protein
MCGRRRTARWLTAFAVVALLPVACAGDAHLVSVEPAPTPGAVAFAVADRSLVYGLTVMTCRGRVMWTISNAQNVQSPARIIYGVTPNGFASSAGPKPLTPGCYKVVVSGPSTARFNIGADGHLEKRPTT